MLSKASSQTTVLGHLRVLLTGCLSLLFSRLDLTCALAVFLLHPALMAACVEVYQILSHRSFLLLCECLAHHLLSKSKGGPQLAGVAWIVTLLHDNIIAP